MNRIGDRVGRSRFQLQVGEILHCTHMNVIPGEQLHSRFGGGDTEESSGNEIRIASLNIWLERAGGIEVVLHALHLGNMGISVLKETKTTEGIYMQQSVHIPYAHRGGIVVAWRQEEV